VASACRVHWGPYGSMYINPKNVQKWIGNFECFFGLGIWGCGGREWYLINYFMGIVWCWLVRRRMRCGVGGDLTL
jgi:hypothetical protein